MKQSPTKKTSFDEPTTEGAVAQAGGPEGMAGDTAAEIDVLREALDAATREARQNHENYLLERADLENFKKRIQKEKSERVRYAAEHVVRDLLPFVDNLERALDHAESAGEDGSLVEGVRMVLNGVLDTLKGHGVTRVDAVGTAFDPALHEALEQVVDGDRAANHVVDQFLPGYKLHDRLLRAAQVSVAVAPSEEGNTKNEKD